MPTYKITAPDGNSYNVTAPDGATQEQVLAYAQANYQHPAVEAGQTHAAAPDLPTATASPTPEQTAEAQPRSFGEDLGRAAIMTGRNVVHGVLGIPAQLHDALVMTPYNAIASAIGSDSRINPGDQQLDSYMNAAGIPNPQPENATERVVSAVERGVSGAGGFMGFGKTLAKAADPLVAGIGNSMSANAGNQIASAATGATSAELAHEAGAGPGWQLVAGLAGGALPSAPQLAQVGVQGLVRGGEAGRQRVAQNIADFETAGTMPTVGQAAQNARMQGAESLLSKTPGAVGQMRGTAQNQAEQVAQGMEGIAGRLAPMADPAKAGRTIERGISGAGGFLDRFKAESKNLYDKLDDVFPSNTPIFVNNTESALAKLTTPTNRMQATSGQFIDSKLDKLRASLGEDLDWNALMGRGRTVPYQGLKELRSRIGEKLADIGFGVGDNSIARSDLKRLYGALSQDMGDAVRGVPEAQRAWGRANAYYAAGQSRIDALSRVVDKNGGPEAVFNAATSGTKDGATTLRTVMQSLKPDEQKVLASTMIRRLGKATPGQQNAAGDEFSMATFLTNWNKLSPQAKGVMFDRFGKGFRDDMDAVARMASNVRQGSKVFANPSGTATTGAGLTAAGTIIGSFLTGHPGIAAATSAGVAGANLTARLMSNPAFVRFLAKSIRTPKAGMAANATNLYQIARSNGDDDLRAAADLMQQAPDDNADDRRKQQNQ